MSRAMGGGFAQASACPAYNLRGFAANSITAALINPLDFSTHNNFLSFPGSIISNQKGDLLRFSIPENYSHFQCFAFSKFTSIVKKFDFPT